MCAFSFKFQSVLLPEPVRVRVLVCLARRVLNVHAAPLAVGPGPEQLAGGAGVVIELEALEVVYDVM